MRASIGWSALTTGLMSLLLAVGPVGASGLATVGGLGPSTTEDLTGPAGPNPPRTSLPEGTPVVDTTAGQGRPTRYGDDSATVWVVSSDGDLRREVEAIGNSLGGRPRVGVLDPGDLGNIPEENLVISADQASPNVSEVPTDKVLGGLRLLRRVGESGFTWSPSTAQLMVNVEPPAGGDGAGELPRTFQVNSVAVEVPGLANGGGPESIPLQPGEAEGSFSTERLDSRLQAGSDHVAVTVGFDLFPERTGGAAPDVSSQFLVTVQVSPEQLLDAARLAAPATPDQATTGTSPQSTTADPQPGVAPGTSAPPGTVQPNTNTSANLPPTTTPASRSQGGGGLGLLPILAAVLLAMAIVAGAAWYVVKRRAGDSGEEPPPPFGAADQHDPVGVDSSHDPPSHDRAPIASAGATDPADGAPLTDAVPTVSVPATATAAPADATATATATAESTPTDAAESPEPQGSTEDQSADGPARVVRPPVTSKSTMPNQHVDPTEGATLPEEDVASALARLPYRRRVESRSKLLSLKSVRSLVGSSASVPHGSEALERWWGGPVGTGGLLMGGWSEKVDGKGEDAPPLVLSTSDLTSAIVAVADGLGGAGARTVRTPNGEATAAQVASRQVLDQLAAWWSETGEAPQPDLLDLKRALAGILRVQLGHQEEAGLIGTLVREYPSTLAAAMVRRRHDRSYIRVIWAGDSRVYLLDKHGFGLLTTDQVSGDADELAQLYVDPQMTNMISADRSFNLMTAETTVEGPFLLLTATDGCFGYLPGPGHFEAVLWDEIEEAASPDEWARRLTRRFNGVAGDDTSFAGMLVGSSFESLKGGIGARHEMIRRDQVLPVERTLGGDERRLEVDAAWQRYRGAFLARRSKMSVVSVDGE